MSANSPWWLSEGEPQDRSQSLGFDLGGLAAGAQQVLEWARDSLLTTHQGHVNPADYPQCLMCRAVQLFQQSPQGQVPTEEHDFHWIELDPPRG